MKSLFSIAAMLAMAVSANAALKFNEVLVDVVGTDQGQEFIEIKSTAASESLTGVTLVVIEGDGASAGVVDAILDLGQFGSTGSNGLLLLRDALTVLQPAPHPATNVVHNDFNPDLENGTNTFLLVRGFNAITVGTDLDTNNDGVLDSTPWASIDDAYSVTDTAATTDFMYAAQIGFPNFVYSGYFPDAVSRVLSGPFMQCDVTVPAGSTTGPYSVFFSTTLNRLLADAPDGTDLNPPASWTLTPGSENLGFISIVNPTNIAIVSGFGTLLGGNLASLNSSDDNKYAVLSDEFSTDAKVNITTTITGTISDLNILAETSTVRENMIQFIYVLDPVTGEPVDPALDIRALTLTDDAFSVDVPNASNYRACDNSIKFQVVFAPSESYLDAPDWVSFIDRFVFEVTP